MPKGKNQHVVPHQTGWAVEREGASKATQVFATQQKAIDGVREIAQNQQSEVVIHRQDGTIRDRDSYGNDPYPAKDRKY